VGALAFPICELEQEELRRKSVLVLRGTGFNFWHYLPFLRSLRLGDLAQFQAIYTISGSTLLLWLYCLMEQGVITLSAASAYDRAMRHCLNRHGCMERVARMLTGRYPYRAEDFLRVFDLLTIPEAWRQTMDQLPLQNWRVVAHDEGRRELVLLEPQAHPGFAVGEVISRAVTWSRLLHLPFCWRTPYHGMLIGDFDFAGTRVHRQFYEHLRAVHASAQVYQINLFRNEDRGAHHFIRVGPGRLARFWQIIDFAAFYLGIANPRYLRAATRELPGR
jgi:hypothetical protein